MSSSLDTGSPTVDKRAVALELERLRLEAGLDRKQAAAAVGCAPSKIGHLETWRNQPSYDDLAAMLRAYGRVDRFAELWERTERGRQRGFWERHAGTEGPEGFDTYVGLEQGASELRIWDLSVINGLLQTEAYARALFTSYTPVEPERLAQLMDLRLRRQRVLYRQPPPHLHVIIEEGVLHRQVGGAQTMRNQLTHLATLTAHPTITIQILPLSAGAHPGTHNPFAILTFPQEHDPGCVYIETRRQSLWGEEDDDISEYRTLFNHLIQLAAPAHQTPILLNSIAKDHHQ